MAWVKVPPANHPIFRAALPKDPRVETKKMFGGVAAKVNGHMFAGLFGRSTVLLLAEPDRAAALALDGASLFDPMGDGRARSDKVMLPESTMTNPAELRGWIARAFKAASVLPKKEESARARKAAAKSTSIDAYLATVTGDTRTALDKLRKTIRSIVPRAEECISYGMPAFRLDGRVIGGFQATAKGCSYYPFSGATLQTLAGDLRAYGKTKSALHFRPDEPLPVRLVRKLINARIAESR